MPWRCPPAGARLTLLAAAFMGAASPAAAQEPKAALDATALIQQGARFYHREGSPICHRIAGAGGTVGPALDGVAARRPDAAWHLPEPQLRALAAYLLTLR